MPGSYEVTVGLTIIVLVGVPCRLCQDCFFYHTNTSEVYTTAFFAVPEDTEIDSVIASVDARIALRVTLQPDDDGGDGIASLLQVVIRDNSSVQIIVRRPLTSLLPTTRSLSFHLQCTGPSGAFTSLPFLIRILDVNDHAPSFEKRFYEVTISEFHGIGLGITPANMKAVDGDLPNTPNTELSYLISGGNELEYFLISNSAEGFVVLQKKLDYETGPRHFRLNITVSDRGEVSLSNWTSLVVIVADEDDQDPVFEEEVYDVSITEELDSFKSILDVRAWDGDTGLNETLKYEIIDGLHNFLQHFVIDHVSGAVSLLEPIDREQLPPSALGHVSLTIQASQVNDPSRTARCAVRIFITDINDNGPRFVENKILKEIDLLPSIFTLEHLDLVQLAVFDRDAVQNAGFVSFLEMDGNKSSQMASLIRIEPQTGTNQTIVLRMENITALLRYFESEVTLTVVVADAKRNRRNAWTPFSNETNSMIDIAKVHLKFNPVWPNFLRSAADLAEDGLPPDAKAFMAQYPITLLIIFGSLICILLIVILAMAAVYHKTKARQMRRIRPFLVSGTCSTRSSVLTTPVSLTALSTESQA